MADGDAPVVGRIAPVQRYYLCIDGTGSQDSVEYGRLLQDKPFGWRNLANEFLEPDPKASPGDERLLDPSHPFLPICTIPVRGLKDPIAVVCPGGRDGAGLDAFWLSYIGETPEEQANQGRRVFDATDRGSTGTFEFFGRHSASTKSTLFMQDLILVPAIERGTDDQGKPLARFKDGPLPGFRNSSDPDVPAELLIVSSHGWLGGFMRGDEMQPSAAAQPVKAQDKFGPPFPYFLVGRAAQEGDVSVGPLWVILAQCSTVNNATWPLWVKLMARGIPPVRGVLAYEEVSPGVAGSINIARAFFALARQGQTMLNAWRGANASEKWAAIVHEEALGDRLLKWDELPKLTKATFTATESSYLAFGASLELGAERLTKGKKVLDTAPPFGMKLERFFAATPTSPETFQEITEDTLERARARLLPDVQFRMTITPPSPARITSATIRWVHMRESQSRQPPLTTLFRTFVADPAGSLDLALSPRDPRTLTAKPTAGPVDSMVITWTTNTNAVLERSGMEHEHSYVWPLVRIDLVGGAKAFESFPFSTRGLLF